MTTLTSRQNPKIKQARALRQRKQRQASGLFIVEGIRHVGAAVEGGAELDYLLYSPEMLTSEYAWQLIEQLESDNIPCYATLPDIFKSLAEKEHPQGILAVVRQALTPLDSLTPADFPWGVALVSPQDPGNLGTILRTIDAAGASGLIVLDGGVDIFHPTVVRASMGTLFSLPVVAATFEQFTAWAQEHSYHLYGSSAQGTHSHTSANYQSPAILLLGSERAGLTDAQQQACDTIISLPMHGQASSLNLSVAAGILIYAMQTDLLGDKP